MLPHQRLPTGFRRVQRALSRRRRCAAAHLSDTASPCHLPSRGGFGARRLRGKAPLEGSWREATERCCRTNGFPQSFGLCNRRSRAAALRAAHLSVTAPPCHLPSRGGFGVRRLKQRLPLRGAGAKRLRGVTAPKASHRVSACAIGAHALPPCGRHTSPSRFACHLSSRRGFGVRRLRGKAPLEGSWQP